MFVLILKAKQSNTEIGNKNKMTLSDSISNNALNCQDAPQCYVPFAVLKWYLQRNASIQYTQCLNYFFLFLLLFFSIQMKFS